MPVADDPGRTAGRVLLDDSGAAIARFEQAEREDRQVADLFTLADGVAPDQAARVVMAELAGWRVAAEEPFGRLLAAAGGRPQRRGHVMSRDLVRDPAPTAWLEPALPAGVRLIDVDRPAIDLAPACLAAYPREHPDFDHVPAPERPETELDEIISGRLMGPLLRCSSLAVGEDGAVLTGQRHVRQAADRRALDRAALPPPRRPRDRRTAATARARARHARRAHHGRAGGDARQPGTRPLRGAWLRRDPRLAHRRPLNAQKPR